MAWWSPALWGAAIGGGIDLLRGRDPRRGALLGGATGGLLGGKESLLGQTEFGKKLFETGSIFQPSNPSASVAGTIQSSPEFLKATTPEIGMANTFNTAQGGLYNQIGAPASYLGSTGELGANMGLINAMDAAPVAAFGATAPSILQGSITGGLTNLSDTLPLEKMASDAASQTGMLDSLKEYATPQNLIGVSALLSNMANTPRPVASNMGGNQITGTPPKFAPFTTGQVYTRKRGNR
jgi:hypothetical protein